MSIADYRSHYRAIVRLGVPIMLGQLGIIVVGFADNIMVGHHSAQELAAASFVNNFFNLVFIFGMGFSYGLTPLVGEAYAGKAYGAIGGVLKNSLVINFAVGVLLSLCMLFLLIHIEWLGQPEELIPLIVPYYILQLFSVLFAMLFNSFKQFSEGTTDTLTPMWIMLSANLLNIVGNYFLIYGHGGFPELGLTGAGISTLASRICTVLFFAVLFMRRQRYRNYREGFRQTTVNRSRLRALMRIGLPVGFQMGVETGSFSLSVIMMGWLGTVALAAHQIAGVVTTLGFMVYYGIAAAVTIRVSAFKGTGDRVAIRRASFAGLHIITGVALLVILLIFFFRNQIGYLFTPDPAIAATVAYLAWPVILYQFGDGLQILFANALRGIADVKYMAAAALFCHFGLALPIGYLCGFVLDWGPIGVWCGFPVSLTTLGLLLWRRFDRLTKRAVSPFPAGHSVLES